jgi:hypothetical protein
MPGMDWTYDGSYRIDKLTFVSVVVRVAVVVCIFVFFQLIFTQNREKNKRRRKKINRWFYISCTCFLAIRKVLVWISTTCHKFINYFLYFFYRLSWKHFRVARRHDNKVNNKTQVKRTLTQLTLWSRQSDKKKTPLKHWFTKKKTQIQIHDEIFHLSELFHSICEAFLQPKKKFPIRETKQQKNLVGKKLPKWNTEMYFSLSADKSGKKRKKVEQLRMCN